MPSILRQSVKEEQDHVAAFRRPSRFAISVDDAMAHFRGAKRDLVERHLDTLAIMGEVVRPEAGRYRLASGALTVA